MTKETDYDLIIIGGGPAGLTAGIFAGRRKIKCAIFDGGLIGGQISKATIIENYPGMEKISGLDLVKTMRKQVESFGCDIIQKNIVSVELKEDIKRVSDGKKWYTTKTVLISTGSEYRHLGVPGEKEFVGKGVAYCASCDAPLYKDKKVAVIGGSNSAATAVMWLLKYTKDVYFIHRRNEMRAEEVLSEEVKKSKATKMWNSTVKEIKGDKFVKQIVVENLETKEQKTIDVDGVFIEIGSVPTTTLAKSAGVKLNDKGFIDVNKDQETNIPGIYAAGDATGGIMQMTECVGDGSIAATSAYMYIKRKFADSKPYFVKEKK